MLEVAFNSLRSRRGSVMLTLASLTISMAIVIGVEHIRAQAENSFVRTVSGVDLLVVPAPVKLICFYIQSSELAMLLTT